MAEKGHWSGWTANAKLRACLAALLGFVILLIHESLSPLNHLAREVGFALVVAVLIWVTFEYFSQTEAEDVWKARIEAITKNVFYGVLHRSLPEGLVKEANILVLSSFFIRKDLTIDYTIEDDEFGEGENKEAFVKLMCTLRYKILNISDEDKDFPFHLGVPNPIIPAMKQKCDVLSVGFQRRNAAREALDISAQRAKFRDQTDAMDSHFIFECGSARLSPGEEIDVDLTYVMAKEVEDAEVFETKYPTDSVRLTVVDRTPGSRIVRARAHHPSNLSTLSDGNPLGPFQFKLNRYILPHQGVSIWWKRKNRPGTQTKVEN